MMHLTNSFVIIHLIKAMPQLKVLGLNPITIHLKNSMLPARDRAGDINTK